MKKSENGVSARRLAKNSAKKIALTAAAVALAYVVSLLSFPLFPQTPWLKLDFSYAVMLIAGYMLGPVAAEAVIVILQLLSLFNTGTGGVGELANFIMANVFVFLPVFVYRYKKGLPWVIVTLVVCAAGQIVAGLLFNKFLLYPLFFKENAAEMFRATVGFIAGYNAIKCVANGAITVLLYKRLRKLISGWVELR